MRAPIRTIRAAVFFSLACMGASGVIWAQDSSSAGPAPQQNTAPSGGWRRFGDQSADRSANPSDPSYQASSQAPNGPQAGEPQYQYNGPQANGPQATAPQGGPQGYNAPPPPPPVPAQLTLKPGTFLTIRLNQALSSDHNQAGDAFAATLERPVVVDGVVVAERGQTIGGRVSEAKKAGRMEGLSRLGIQLTDMTLVDGSQVPIQTQLISRDGPSSVGQETANGIGAAALGAVIGAVAGGGEGAAIGAGAGATAGLIGAWSTRGRPTIMRPESVLTFRVEAPVTIATDKAPYAFRYMDPREYDRPPSLVQQSRVPPPGYAAPGYGAPGYAGYGAPPPYYGAPYVYSPYPYYPYYYGPSVGFYFGRGFGYGRPYYRFRR